MAQQQRPLHPSLSARDAEQLLSGRKPASAELVDVHDALGSLRDAVHEYSSRDADDQARVLSQAALDAAPTTVLARQHRALTRRSRPMKTRARIASAMGAVVALFLGTTGAAMAAEDTVPGDTFYGLKIAFENVGLTEGGFGERLREATVLSERGDDADALTHLANSLEDADGTDEDGTDALEPCPAPEDDTLSPSPSPEPTLGALTQDQTEGEQPTGDETTDGTEQCASDDLRRAAEAVLSNGSEQSLEVRTAVAEMLQWMSTTDAEGREFGQGVAERARAIGGNPHGDDAEVGDKTAEGDLEATDSDEADAPGNRPEKAGPPEGRGPSADKDDKRGGKDGGRPDDAGPPGGNSPGNGGGPPQGKGRP